MFSVGRIMQAPDSAEATASYWAWRVSRSGGPEEELLLRGKTHQTVVGVRGPAFTDDALLESVAESNIVTISAFAE